MGFNDMPFADRFQPPLTTIRIRPYEVGVAADDAAGVRRAVSHLAELGHRRIAHVTGPQSLSTTMIRSRAFRDAMVEERGDGAPAPVLHAEAFTIAAGRGAADDLLRAREGVTAIVAGNDMIALGCYVALAAAGLSCPEDISIVGHNDMPLVDRVQPPLTTVAIPQRRIGTEAARLLLERLGGDEAPIPRILLDTELIVRGSTGPPKRLRAQPSAAQDRGEAVDSRTTSSGSS